MWIKSLHEQIHRMIKSPREPAWYTQKRTRLGFILPEWLTDHSLIKQAIFVVLCMNMDEWYMNLDLILLLLELEPTFHLERFIRELVTKTGFWKRYNLSDFALIRTYKFSNWLKLHTFICWFLELELATYIDH